MEEVCRYCKYFKDHTCLNKQFKEILNIETVDSVHKVVEDGYLSEYMIENETGKTITKEIIKFRKMM